jgi:hypothetical protein
MSELVEAQTDAAATHCDGQPLEAVWRLSIGARLETDWSAPEHFGDLLDAPIALSKPGALAECM